MPPAISIEEKLSNLFASQNNVMREMMAQMQQFQRSMDFQADAIANNNSTVVGNLAQSAQAIAAASAAATEAASTAAAAQQVVAEAHAANNPDDMDEDDDPTSLEELWTEMNSGVDKEIVVEVQRLSKDYLRRAHLYGRSKDGIEKLTAERTKLNNNQLPVGHKPFKVPFEDPVWDERVETEFVADIRIPAGTNRERLEKLYYQYLFFKKDLEKRAFEGIQGRLRPELSYSAFSSSVKAGITNIHTLEIANLGIPCTELKYDVESDKIRKFIIRAYRGSILALKRERHAKAEKEEKTRKQKQLILDKAAKLNPQEVLRSAIQEELAAPKDPKGKAKGKGKGKLDFTQQFANWATTGQNNHTFKPEPVNKPKGKGKGKGKGTDTKGKGKGAPGTQQKTRQYTKTELSNRKMWPRKNGPPPGAARGQNYDTTQKGIGKGKTKDKGKGKGRRSTSNGAERGGGKGAKGRGQGAGRNR